MSTDGRTALGNWTEDLNQRVRLIHEEIASLHAWVAEAGGDENVLNSLVAPYYETLQEIYENDYYLAKALDSSDLLLRYQGPAVETDHPRVSLLSSVFTDVRGQVGRVAMSIAGILEDYQRMPKEMDLTLAALAKGSLYVGFTLPSKEDLEGDDQEALFKDEKFFEAAREALRTLGLVTRHLQHDSPPGDLEKEIPDADVRNVALAAIETLSPSGHKGIQSVWFSGKGIGSQSSYSLTPQSRETIRAWLEEPDLGAETMAFIGTVREMDLDARRFELRGVEDDHSDIKCQYAQSFDDVAKGWLDVRVRAYGEIERNSRGKVSSLQLIRVEPV